MRRPLLAVLGALALAVGRPATATGEPWYRGARGTQRVLHVAITAGAEVFYGVSETFLKPYVAPETCRWCAPPGIDTRVRDALRWNNIDRARLYSHLTGYVAVPVMAIGITALTALSSDDAGWARLIDDTIPVLESVTISEIVSQVGKWAVARQRPFVHFGDPPPTTDDNMSFWSGHAAVAFSLTTSAGMIAHGRGSAAEPYIWGIGLPLSAAACYFRIAGDKHYLTDVVTGAGIGVLAGLTIPRLLRRGDRAAAAVPNVVLVPQPGGAAIVGAF